MAGRRGRRQRAVAQGLHRERRGQNPARNHHADDVRPLARLRRHVAKLGINFEQHFAKELAALAPFAADGLVKLKPGASK